MGSNVVDEMDCGSYFDHIDDLIEFPTENDNGLGYGNCNNFPSIWTNTSSEGLPCSDPIFSSGNNSAADLSAELDVPYEDIVQLEWLSTFVEDSFSGGGLTMNKENIPIRNEAAHKQFQTSSPVSVLESSSSSSCSGGKTIPLSSTQRGPQRARSKRPRPAIFNPRSAMQLLSLTSSVTETRHHVQLPMISYESDNFSESHPVNIPKPAAPEQKKKKKPKISFRADPIEMDQIEPSQAAVRKCMHCEITKTPQWRAGPMGPKTLCNACGVRYKSGRLFPEYRPAASPTFVPSLHSNSHKKVIEMRVKGSEKKVPMGNFTPVSAESILIPNKNASLDYI